MRYASLLRFCWPMKCQAIMKLNMNRPHRKAKTIQISSTRSIGSFHQIRCSGGETAMAGPPYLSSLGKRDGGNFHHAPEDVENGWQRHAEKKQQKRIIQYPLHDRDALWRISSRRGRICRHRHEYALAFLEGRTLIHSREPGLIKIKARHRN